MPRLQEGWQWRATKRLAATAIVFAALQGAYHVGDYNHTPGEFIDIQAVKDRDLGGIFANPVADIQYIESNIGAAVTAAQKIASFVGGWL